MAEPVRLFVRGPIQDVADKEHVRWLLWLARTDPTADIDFQDTHGWGVAWGRREIVKAFLRSRATHLWMVDTDTVPPRSLHLLDHAWDYPALTGLYLGVTEKGIRYHLYKQVQDRWVWIHPRHVAKERLLKVDAAGGGCLLIRRDLLEEHGPGVFAFGETPDGEPIGEDMLFGQAIGGLMADTHYVCNHFRRADLIHVWQTVRTDFLQQGGRR